MKNPYTDKITIARKIHIVQPPNNSKLPSPKADAAKVNNGKQQGEKNAVIKIPIVANLSILFTAFILLKLVKKKIFLFQSLKIVFNDF